MSCRTGFGRWRFPSARAIIWPVDLVPYVINFAVRFVKSDAFQSKSCADQLKALSEPIRLRIIDILRHGELTVGDIAEFLETEMVTVSHHLKILKHADLVDVKRDGRFMVYSLRHDLLQKATGNSRQFLNLGCCRIEVPANKPS
ncbi:MAG: metalloregulator ArsR/SmtB family transcription factor [Planctomycetaceae bacterium]